MENEQDKKYDVAISFAGEDCASAESIAKELRAAGVRVFYQYYEVAALWGANLQLHLREIYREGATFVLVLVSEHYVKKVWPTHEFQSALEKALELGEKEYILPVRIDGTKLPGLRTTIGYLSITLGARAIADLIVEKLESRGRRITTQVGAADVLSSLLGDNLMKATQQLEQDPVGGLLGLLKIAGEYLRMGQRPSAAVIRAIDGALGVVCEVQSFEMTTGDGMCAVLSSDKKLVAACSGGPSASEVWLWQVSGELLFHSKRHFMLWDWVDFTSDGQHIVSATDRSGTCRRSFGRFGSANVQIWDLAGNQVGEPRTGRYVPASGSEPTILEQIGERSWNVRRLDGSLVSVPIDAEFISPIEGDLILASVGAGAVEVRTANANLVASLHLHVEFNSSLKGASLDYLEFLPGGDRFISRIFAQTGRENSKTELSLWDCSGQLIRSFGRLNDREELEIRADAASQTLAIAWGRTLHLYDFNGNCVAGPVERVKSIAFSRSGPEVYYGTWFGEIGVLCRSGINYGPVKRHNGKFSWVEAIRFDEDGDLALSTDHCGGVRIWDAALLGGRTMQEKLHDWSDVLREALSRLERHQRFAVEDPVARGARMLPELIASYTGKKFRKHGKHGKHGDGPEIPRNSKTKKS